jgi:hypothetical protein
LGLNPPDDVAKSAPTDRTLRGVAHLYNYAADLPLNPTKTVEHALRLSRSTTARWIMKAWKAGYLGKAEAGRIVI